MHLTFHDAFGKKTDDESSQRSDAIIPRNGRFRKACRLFSGLVISSRDSTSNAFLRYQEALYWRKCTEDPASPLSARAVTVILCLGTLNSGLRLSGRATAARSLAGIVAGVPAASVPLTGAHTAGTQAGSGNARTSFL